MRAVRGGDRLLIVSGNQFPLDDWQHPTANIWKSLSEHFDEVHIFSPGHGQSFAVAHKDRIHLHTVPALGGSMKGFLASSWLLAATASRVCPTHVVSQSAVFGGPAAVRWASRHSIPSVVEIHGEYYFGPGPLANTAAFRGIIKPSARHSFQKATRIRVLADKMADQVREVYGEAAANKCVVVPPRVDTVLFRPRTEYRPSIDSVICIGSLIPLKGHASLIRGLAKIQPRLRLTILGEGPERVRLKSLARELNLELRLPGRLPHELVAEELTMADIYVHPSTTEAVPRAVLEAMAAGLPVITSSAGYLADEIIRSEAGLIFDPQDASTLARAIRILEDKASRVRFGQNSRRLVDTKYEWHAQMEAYAQLIRGQGV